MAFPTVFQITVWFWIFDVGFGFWILWLDCRCCAWISHFLIWYYEFDLCSLDYGVGVCNRFCSIVTNDWFGIWDMILDFGLWVFDVGRWVYVFFCILFARCLFVFWWWLDILDLDFWIWGSRQFLQANEGLRNWGAKGWGNPPDGHGGTSRPGLHITLL